MQLLDTHYDAVPDSIARARRELAACAARAGADDDQLEAIRLAVSEAVTNAVLHGYRGAPGDIAVRADLGARGLTIRVSDAGAGAQTPALQPGMGRGLALIAEVSDAMSVRPGGRGGTELWMRFALPDQSPVALPAAA